MKRAFWIVSIVVGLAGVAAIPYFVGVRQVFETVGRVGWAGILVFIANSMVILFAPAVGWWMLLRGEGIAAPFRLALTAQWMGHPVNYTTPSMYLAGDAVRTFYVAKMCGIPKRRVLATIVVSKFQEFSGWFFSLIISTSIFIKTTDVLKPGAEKAVAIAMGVLVFMYGIVFYSISGNFKFTVKAVHFLARIKFLRRRMARLRRHADEMEELVHLAFRKRIGIYILSQLVTLLAAASVFLRPWVFFAFLPESGATFQGCLEMTVLTNLVNAAGIIPAGLGIFDAAMAWQGKEFGAAYAIVNRISDLVLFAIGAWVIFHHGMKRWLKGPDDSFKLDETRGA